MHAVESDESLCHFGALRKLMAKPEKDLGRILCNSGSAFAAQEFQAFYGHSSENFRHGAYSGLLYRLSPWTSENIVRLTRTTDLDVEQLKKELFTFYLSVPSRKTHLKPIAALVFNFLLDLVLDYQFKFPISLFLDEFTNFGYIPGIDEALSIIRRRHISCALGVQDFKQMDSVYRRDKADIIRSQLGTRIFFRPRNIRTAKEISESLGNKTVSDRRLLDSGHVQEREVGRPLFAASDLMAMRADELLVMTPSTGPLITRRFSHEDFAELQSTTPPARKTHPVEEAFMDKKASKPKHTVKKDMPEDCEDIADGQEENFYLP